jgi:hypothetical protein
MALRLMQDATHLVSNTPFVRFKVRFIRFGQSHPVKSRSKVVSFLYEKIKITPVFMAPLLSLWC